MESFEHVVKVYLESLGYAVSCGVKFSIRLRVNSKGGKKHYQRHGYEVDVVAAKHGELLLGSVKSFFGSKGVNKQGFKGLADPNRQTHFPRYLMFNRLKKMYFNDPVITMLRLLHAEGKIVAST